MRENSLDGDMEGKIHHQISDCILMIVDFGRALGTSKVLEACKLSLRNPGL